MVHAASVQPIRSVDRDGYLYRRSVTGGIDGIFVEKTRQASSPRHEAGDDAADGMYLPSDTDEGPVRGKCGSATLVGPALN